MVSAIEQQWAFVTAHPDSTVRGIAERAAEEPTLRALFPYASMSNLKFSRTTTYPYDPMPYILTVEPGQRYEVRGADNAPIASGTLDDMVAELARILSQ